MSHHVANILSLAVLMASPGSFSAQKEPSQSGDMVSDQQAIDIVAKKLCKAEPIVGTRIPTPRKCETPAQLRAYNAQAREMIESYRQRTPCIMGMESGEKSKAMPC